MTLGERLLNSYESAIHALDDQNLRTLIRELQRREGETSWGPDWEALYWYAEEEAVARFLSAKPVTATLQHPGRN